MKQNRLVRAMFVAFAISALSLQPAIADDDQDDDKEITITIDGLSGIGELIGDILDAVGGSLGSVMEHFGGIAEHLDRSGFISRHMIASNDDEGDATEISETQTASSDGSVKIYNLAGSIEVIGWDKNEISVEGTLGESVERLEFDVDDDRTEIEVVIPRRNHQRVRHVASHLIVHVPKASTVEVESISAPITVSEVVGDEIQVETISGAVRITGCQGDIEAESISGSVTVTGNPDDVQVSSVTGSISVEGVQRRLEAETVSGSLVVEAGTLSRCQLETVSGSLRFNGGIEEDGRLEVECFSGAVVLNFTNDVFGKYTINTFSGSIDCDYCPKPDSVSKFTREKELRFKHGDGNARVSIETFSGSVTIRRN